MLELALWTRQLGEIEKGEGLYTPAVGLVALMASEISIGYNSSRNRVHISRRQPVFQTESKPTGSAWVSKTR